MCTCTLLVSQVRQTSSLGEYSSVGHLLDLHPSLLLHSMRTNTTIIFLELYCHHWKKSCNSLILHLLWTQHCNHHLSVLFTTKYSHSLNNFSLGWILHRNSRAQIPCFWVPQTTKRRLVGAKLLAAFPCKFVSSPHNILPLLSSKFKL